MSEDFVTQASEVDRSILAGYMNYLVGRFFKILPMRESEDRAMLATLPTYMISLRDELVGYESFGFISSNNPSYLSLICILQFLLDHPDEPVAAVKREVFRAISICNKLSCQYMENRGAKK